MYDKQGNTSLARRIQKILTGRRLILEMTYYCVRKARKTPERGENCVFMHGIEEICYYSWIYFW